MAGIHSSLISLYPFQQIGVDEGEHDHADAFDFDYHMLVFTNTLHIAFHALVGAACDPYMLVFLEIPVVVYFATACVGRRCQSQQVD